MPESLPAGVSDPADQEWDENVRPSDWVNPTPAGTYNLVVIGGGTAGLVCAAAAAGLGAKAALIEQHRLGGDCLNYGCVPSKALIASARTRARLKTASAAGIELPPGWELSADQVMQRLRRLRAGISHHDSAKRFRSLGVDVYLGQGSFLNKEVVAVGGRALRFRKAVIATGARPRVPDIPGLDQTGFLTNETVFSLDSIPENLLVLGGGPIGCELAQAFHDLGSRVTLVEAGPRLIPREDPDASLVLTQSLRDSGLTLHLQASVARVWKDNGKRFAEVTTGVGADAKTLLPVAFDHLLVAIGRRPNWEELSLEKAGVRATSAGIEVNNRLQTSNPRIFAAGDVASRFQFTHAADAMARIVIQNALFYGSKRVDALTIPWCTYTTPEVARVGLNEDEAKAARVEVDVFKVAFSDVDRAILESEERGFVKILVRRRTDEIVGATIVGESAGEMISEVTMAINANVGLGTLASVIHPYPTRAEAIRKAGDAYNRTRLTPMVRRLLEFWFRWIRGN